MAAYVSQSYGVVLEYIAVAPELRGDGIGRALVDALAGVSGQVVAETDDDAVGFYRALDFRHRPCAVGPALAGAPPLPLCAAVLILNDTCRGLRFAPRTYSSGKRQRPAPPVIWRRTQPSGCKYVLDRRRREAWWLELAGDESYRGEEVLAATSRGRRSLRLRTTT